MDVEEIKEFKVKMSPEEKKTLIEASNILRNLLDSMKDHHCNRVRCADYELKNYISRESLDNMKNALIDINNIEAMFQ